MATLYTLIGIPGSGKSTYAENIIGNTTNDIKVVSSDKIREELYGNEATQGDNNKIFSIVHDRIKHYLYLGKDVIFDATNINPKNREKAFEDGADCNIAVWFDIPLEECKKRNSGKDRKVPEFVLDKMYKNLVPPTKEEGYNVIYHYTLGDNNINDKI